MTREEAKGGIQSDRREHNGTDGKRNGREAKEMITGAGNGRSTSMRCYSLRDIASVWARSFVRGIWVRHRKICPTPGTLAGALIVYPTYDYHQTRPGFLPFLVATSFGFNNYGRLPATGRVLWCFCGVECAHQCPGISAPHKSRRRWLRQCHSDCY